MPLRKVKSHRKDISKGQKVKWDYFPNGNSTNPFLIPIQGKWKNLKNYDLNHLKSSSVEYFTKQISINENDYLKASTDSCQQIQQTRMKLHQKVLKENDEKKILKTISLEINVKVPTVISLFNVPKKTSKSNDLIKNVFSTKSAENGKNEKLRIEKVANTNGISPLTKNKQKGFNQITRTDNKTILKPLLQCNTKKNEQNNSRRNQVAVEQLLKVPYPQTPKWHHGQFPKIIKSKSNPYKRPVPQRQRKLEQKIDKHLKMVLSNLGLEKFGLILSRHQITYMEFLKLKQEDLIELGICNEEEIKKIMIFIKDILDSPSCQQDTPMGQKMHSQLSIGEIEHRTVDITRHINYLGSALQSLSRNLMKDPTGLKLGLEVYPISRITQTIHKLMQCVKDTDKEAYDLQNELTTLMGTTNQSGNLKNEKSKYSGRNYSQIVVAGFVVLLMGILNLS